MSSGLTVTPGNNPLAPANAPADTKLRTCVIGLNIVFATCDVAFGYKIKLSYICVYHSLSRCTMALCSIASATDFSAYIPFIGFVIPASIVRDASISTFLTLGPSALIASTSVS